MGVWAGGRCRRVAAIVACLALPATASAAERVNVIAEQFPQGSDAELLRKATATSWRSLAPASPAGEALASSWCGDRRRAEDGTMPTTGPAIKVVYTRPTDLPDRFAQYADLIQDDVRTAFEYVAGASGGRRTLRFDVGTRCGASYVDITTVDLPHPRSHYIDGKSLGQRYALIHDDVRARAGKPAYTNNMLIYADGLSDGSRTIGVAGMFEDLDAKTANRHDGGDLAAIILGNSTVADASPGFAWGTSRKTAVVHEISHTLGAVQDSAPGSDGSGHCTDGADVMCDGGGVCASEPRIYDCGGNTYFNPAPAAGSYLAKRRNLYDAHFMCQVGRCLPTGGNRSPSPSFVVRSLAGEALGEVPAGARVLLDGSSSSDPEGSVVSWAWDVGADGTIEGDDTVQEHVFPAGTHAVRLTVRDESGAHDSVVATITAVGEPAPAPAARSTAPAGSAPAAAPASKVNAALVRKRVRAAVRAATKRLRKLGARGFARHGLTVVLDAPVPGVATGAVRRGSSVVVRVSTDVTRPGKVRLRLRPRGAKRRSLARTSSGLRVSLSYRPG